MRLGLFPNYVKIFCSMISYVCACQGEHGAACSVNYLRARGLDGRARGVGLPHDEEDVVVRSTCQDHEDSWSTSVGAHCRLTYCLGHAP